jgi:hypothetical protein
VLPASVRADKIGHDRVGKLRNNLNPFHACRLSSLIVRRKYNL